MHFADSKPAPSVCRLTRKARVSTFYPMRKRAVVLAGIALVSFAAPYLANADDWNRAPGLGAFQPQVPISALARPVAWLDPSRFHFSSSFSVGSGFGGTSALQVTSMSYQFRAPMWLNVSLGNAWGPAGGSRNGAPFLEGLDLGFRPLSSMLVRFQYRDLRSPLQYDTFGDPARLWGR